MFLRLNAITFSVISIAITFIFGLLVATFFENDATYVLWPVLACCCTFLMFSYALWRKIRVNIFGEVGFIYLGLALAYTVLPAVRVILTNFIIPIGIDGSSPLILDPEPAVVGAHFWRHALFISGVAVGYLLTRGRETQTSSISEISTQDNDGNIFIVALLLVGAIFVILSLSAPVATYYEHYTRHDHLSAPLIRLVQLSLLFKSGSYFVLMALMFNHYAKYKWYIYVVVPLFCIFEIFYSFGSRIEALTILIAFAGFYHYKVKAFSLNNGLVYLLLLAAIFSAIELGRSAQMNNETIGSMVADEGIRPASEFNAVFNTGFHLYAERNNGSLPPAKWPMFIYELITIIPFVDHTEYHPQYWYARHYFPSSIVPPQTMGVIADSAIWGGEIDLFMRSLLNGAIFAIVTRWLIRRKEKWWAITIYIYVYATCIMTLKYSVLYQLPMVEKIILPVLLITGMLFRLKKHFLHKRNLQ